MLEKISLIAQSAIRIINYDGKNIYFDPFKLERKYKNDADYIFITHSHYDHFSEEDIIDIKKQNTKIVIPNELYEKTIALGFDEANILLVEPNNDYEIDEIKFQTIPAYNINKNFHKREYNWVGYIVLIDGKKMYIAGDTDCIDEAKNIDVDIAFVPVGGTYTMNYLEAVELVKEMKPKLAIPIHYKTIVGSLEDAIKFKELLKDEVEVEILMK